MIGRPAVKTRSLVGHKAFGQKHGERIGFRVLRFDNNGAQRVHACFRTGIQNVLDDEIFAQNKSVLIAQIRNIGAKIGPIHIDSLRQIGRKVEIVLIDDNVQTRPVGIGMLFMDNFINRRGCPHPFAKNKQIIQRNDKKIIFYGIFQLMLADKFLKIAEKGLPAALELLIEGIAQRVHESVPALFHGKRQAPFSHNHFPADIALLVKPLHFVNADAGNACRHGTVTRMYVDITSCVRYFCF